MNGKSELVQKAVRRGKYAALFHFLLAEKSDLVELTFADLEGVLGFSLPDSAYLYRPWWANQAKSGHSQAMAWDAAGWKTALVDLEAETLRFERMGKDVMVLRNAVSQATITPPMEFWVYENWTHKKAIVHDAGCSYCNHGKGMHVDSSSRNGCWHGPFDSLDIAERKANTTGREEIRLCRVCL